MTQHTEAERVLLDLIECAKAAISTGDMTPEEAQRFINERRPLSLLPYSSYDPQPAKD